MKDSEIFTAIAKFDTPAFVFDIDMLCERVNAIRSILDENMAGTGKKISLCYSIKANPFLVPYLKGVVDRFEVCSPGELEIIKHYDISPESIIYSGVNKGCDDVREAVDYNAGTVTIESLRHLEIIRKTASESGRSVNVILRLTGGNQFGMSEADIREILSGCPYENIHIEGLHYFAGTQRNYPGPQEKELKKLENLITQLESDYGVPLNKLEYGPGLPYPYFTKDDFSDTLKPLKNIAESLKTIALQRDLTIEMGRFTASSCGYYMTRICDIKQSGGQNWCILDGGLNHVNYYGQMMGMKCPVIRHVRRGRNNASRENFEKYALCGSLCTSNDILVREMELADPAIGDVLVFENIGAYSVTEGINLFLSRDMAKVAVYKNGEYMLKRDRVSTWKLNSGFPN